MLLAVLGDVHGNFQLAAALLQGWMEVHGQPLNACLQVGDLMPNRDAMDMEFSAAQEKKYRYPGDFARYWSGELRFPCPLLFIGGNHDPWNWLDETLTGGWLTDWLYYLGRATSTEHEGLNICALSGIYHPKKSLVPDRNLMPPAHTASDRKSFTYFVEGEMESLIEHQKTDVPCDVLLLHDWPAGLDRRSFIGNPFSRRLILEIGPRRTFCGHMHRYEQGYVGGYPVVCLNAVHGPGDDAGIGRGHPLFVFDPTDPESGAPWTPPPGLLASLGGVR